MSCAAIARSHKYNTICMSSEMGTCPLRTQRTAVVGVSGAYPCGRRYRSACGGGVGPNGALGHHGEMQQAPLPPLRAPARVGFEGAGRAREAAPRPACTVPQNTRKIRARARAVLPGAPGRKIRHSANPTRAGALSTSRRARSSRPVLRRPCPHTVQAPRLHSAPHSPLVCVARHGAVRFCGPFVSTDGWCEGARKAS